MEKGENVIEEVKSGTMKDLWRRIISFWYIEIEVQSTGGWEEKLDGKIEKYWFLNQILTKDEKA